MLIKLPKRNRVKIYAKSDFDKNRDDITCRVNLQKVNLYYITHREVLCKNARKIC
jgi:hypothetical protein